VAGAALLQVAGVLLPPLRGLLGTEPVTLQVFGLLLALSVLPGLTIWVERLLRRPHIVHSRETAS
jgi:Ca2+-transporting ATPase